ncbi:MAG: phosphatidate cytidylyltransferase [Ruminococcaceae bacterium]|nr:phosphatidate cytidylyltransferase [Oscillospiraceae bacterium]
MKTRILAGAGIVVVLLAVLFLAPTWISAIFVGAMAAIGSYELLWGTGLVKHLRLNIYSAIFAFAVCVWSYFGCPYAFGLLGALLFAALIFGEMMASKLQLQVKDAMLCLASGLLIPFMLASLVRISNMEQGKLMLVIPFIMAFFSDTGAYFIGVLFGKHKMAPVISPKKSWEGFYGGIVVAVLGMALYALLLRQIWNISASYGIALIYGLLGALAGVFGDLSMSVIKRQVGIKDYGNLIPGHGGVLDRFDSVLITAPLTEVLLLILPMVV